MILTPHILAGAAITSQMPHPVLGLAAAVLSHYALDSVRHAEYSIKPIKYLRQRDFGRGLPPVIKIVLDLSVAFTILFLVSTLFDYPLMLVLLGGIAGALPDGLNVIRMLLGNRPKILRGEYIFHQSIHFDKLKKYNPFWGYLWQALVVISAVLSFALLS